MSEAKMKAGRRAADLVESGMVLGLGTGSTMLFCLERLGERIRTEGLQVEGVPTSMATEQAARRLGIPLTDFDRVQRVDFAVDGADEVDPDGNMIKGGGGALLREKIVLAAASRSAIVITPAKRVERLGERFLLPVEVVPFGWWPASRRLEELGCTTLLRRHPSGVQYVTDNGNYILDCRFEGIDDPARLERRINNVPGVVENGLFVGLAGEIVEG